MKIKLLTIITFISFLVNAQLKSNNSTQKVIKINVRNSTGILENKILNANTNGTYSLAGPTDIITPGNSADIKFGDIDGDGYLDAIFNGNSNSGSGRGIAINDGTGIFSRSVLDVTDATISCGMADFDNNGLLDYYVIGNGSENEGTVFFQNTDGTFTKDQSSFSNLNLIDADITTLDFNNDGFIDMFISGWDDTMKNRFSAVFLNDGYGKFTAMNQPNLVQKGYGSSVWGDVNGDGWLDLLLNGDGDANGETSSDIYRLYKNNQGILEPIATFSDYRQISVGDGARMVDWDNDGKLDIILTGWSNNKNRQATMLFSCTDQANFRFTENELSNFDFPGVSESSIETADLNNDGRIDLLITGFNGNQSNQVGKYNRNICGYYLNQSTIFNSKPATPYNLRHTIEYSSNESTVTLSWNPGSDDKTPLNCLTYNVALKNRTTGKWLYNPMAFTSGTNNGLRKVSGHGNVFTNRKWVLRNLPEGSYEWTVQSLDANFVGSSFAIIKIFTIASTDVKSIKANLKFFVAEGKLHYENNSTNTALISIYSTTGNLIQQIKSSTSQIIELKQGIYLVSAIVGKESFVQKIVI